MDRIVARAGTTTFEISSLDPDPAGVIELLTLVQDPLQAAASNYIVYLHTTGKRNRLSVGSRHTLFYYGYVLKGEN